MSHPPRSQAAQIRESLGAQMDSGLLPPGAKLPSERELSELFSTTRITIKDALLALEAEGRIYREDRRGWFVSPPRLVYNPQYRSHFHEMVTRQQRQVETRVLSAGMVLATPALSQALELGPLAQLCRIRRTRSIDGRVVMYVEHHLKPSFFPDILARDLSQSLTLIYQREYGIRYGRSRFDIYPSAARGDVAQALTLAEGSPILLVFRINYDQHGRIIDCDHEYWRHDAIRITVDSQTAERD
ncbi:UTRA domain-containing protein [Paludibacterium purpuratum]|uniref:GntR family transcriptional regulator n=1 Tax=Paludibacterium purpuratum TaxID=1144873 RepID=A0A4V3DVP5_9NEIS|nr:UTRA domain-containing protein [Paludibacterium purpuratum]TDR81489.1 GntR family transcriptional regulator [Paludibacterium purpuratum]